MYIGWDVGSVSLKLVRISDAGHVRFQILRHGGNPKALVREFIEQNDFTSAKAAIATGPFASSTFSLPYLPESLCIEAALEYLAIKPDIVLSLGGESFVVYCMNNGLIRSMISSNRCAAGSGEFIVQQFGRMGFGLEEGLREAEHGQKVPLATRCSVHCKSDATHKLNKNECSPADIARSLIAGLAEKIHNLVINTDWPRTQVAIAGGLARNMLLVQDIKKLLHQSRIELLEHSVCLEGLGAAISARNGDFKNPDPSRWLRQDSHPRKGARPALKQFSSFVTRLNTIEPVAVDFKEKVQVILGVDAGSTTTKAVLIEKSSKKLVAWSYLRTHGNPVRATIRCLREVQEQTKNIQLEIIQVAATGSGREVVSVYLDSCLNFNEILAHARAAQELVPEADTIIEIGGQDAKFVSLLNGIPADYSMNDGCSAGTGSFLEEVCASDLNLTLEEIGPYALSSKEPVVFGERCAAFINSEIRTVLQQGTSKADIVAGLVYAVMENYLTKVAGTRHIGSTIILQGGIALNPGVAPALAALTGRKVVIAPRPELMGCVGAALMAKDLLDSGKLPERPFEWSKFDLVRVEVKDGFTCPSCDNACTIQRIALDRKVYPFGGLCSRWEMQRRPKALKREEGVNLVAFRDDLMFTRFKPAPPARSRGRIGLPLALTTYELYPFFTSLLTELGFEVSLSRPGHGGRRTGAPMCYPAELLHAAVDDLIFQEVDYIFLPYVREFSVPEGHAHGYLCPFTQDSPAVISRFFDRHAEKFISPEIGFSNHLLETTEKEIIRIGEKLGASPRTSRRALAAALAYQHEFEQACVDTGKNALATTEGPVVVLIGRPYLAYAAACNLSIPRKIASRGFNVTTADFLPWKPFSDERNVWHFTQKALSAIRYAKQQKEYFICYLTCFSCTPDAIINHRIRKELEGDPFCFLEIDSQTAHAGIETRIGAFLDIIEGRQQTKNISSSCRSSENQGSPQAEVSLLSARPNSPENLKTVHVILSDLPRITSQMMAKLYSNLGWKAVSTGCTDQDILQTARKVCSGRECLPFLSMVGKMLKHLERRPAGENTVFHLLEQEGPCQVGNWYDAVSIIFERLGAKNAVPVWPAIKNNYLGQGRRVAAVIVQSVIIGDLISEIRSSLVCLASNPDEATSTLNDIEDHLLRACPDGFGAIEKTLRESARKLKIIKLRRDIRITPKVLLFGGIGRIFVNGPVRDFFERQGILVKSADLSEFLSLLASEYVIRSGFAMGRLHPDEQFTLPAILMGLIGSRSGKVLRARLQCQTVGLMEKRWRRFLAPSGLLFAPHQSFLRVAGLGHSQIPANSFCESTFTVGRYMASLQDGFDGFVNIGVFNCAPANVATAVLRSLTSRSDLPYAAIEAESSGITSSQMRQIEMIAARCLRKYKN